MRRQAANSSSHRRALHFWFGNVGGTDRVDLWTGTGPISVINRTFTIDPMAPRVLGVDIEARPPHALWYATLRN